LHQGGDVRFRRPARYDGRPQTIKETEGLRSLRRCNRMRGFLYYIPFFFAGTKRCPLRKSMRDERPGAPRVKRARWVCRKVLPRQSCGRTPMITSRPSNGVFTLDSQCGNSPGLEASGDWRQHSSPSDPPPRAGSPHMSTRAEFIASDIRKPAATFRAHVRARTKLSWRSRH